MTGFARGQWVHQDTQWQMEIKAVNGRNLDLRLRLPDGYDALDGKLRQAISANIKRGSVTVAVTQQRDAAPVITINHDLLAQIQALGPALHGRIHADLPRLEGLLTIPGMVQVKNAVATMPENFVDEFMAGLALPTLNLFNTQRDNEGAHLRQICTQHIAQIQDDVTRAEALLPTQQAAMQQKLTQQLQQLPSVAVEPARVAQELALLLLKADVREELDRLRAHIAAAQKLLGATEPVGRQLDFLAQEFNREANTLCAKSAEIALTQIGLELKNAIDQLREQVQNIE